MTTLLFWNINKKPLLAEINTLCTEHDVDVVLLAECDASATSVQLALNEGRQAPYLCPLNLSERLTILTRYPTSCIKSVLDQGGIAIRHVSPPLGPDFLLVAAHLRSKLHMDEDDQSFSSTRLMHAIADAEESVGHDRTVVIGDLNMNPFEKGVVSAEGLHAVMSKDIAARKTRQVEGKLRKLFYNPMWSRMGDMSKGPPGTYFKDMSNYTNYYWNTFDQVLLRPDLLPYYDDDSLEVITKIGSNSLLRGTRLDDKFSDHLPIYIQLRTEPAI